MPAACSTTDDMACATARANGSPSDSVSFPRWLTGGKTSGTAMARRYWLMKSEPDVFSIQDLAKAPKRTTFWEGVRNYQARNLLRDEIQEGDGVLFYHSSAKPPAVAGTAQVVRAATPTPASGIRPRTTTTPGSTRDQPRWFGVHIALDRIFSRPLPLDELREGQGAGQDDPAPRAAACRSSR